MLCLAVLLVGLTHMHDEVSSNEAKALAVPHFLVQIGVGTQHFIQSSLSGTIRSGKVRVGGIGTSYTYKKIIQTYMYK